MSSRAYLLLPLLLLLAGVTLVGAQAASAIFTDSERGGPATVSTASIAVPSSVKAAQTNCKTNKAPEVKVEWSASSSAGVTGYTVERSPAGSGSFVVVASLLASQRSYTDSNNLAYSTTYEYRVAATLHEWKTTSAAVSMKTLGKLCV